MWIQVWRTRHPNTWLYHLASLTLAMWMNSRPREGSGKSHSHFWTKLKFNKRAKKERTTQSLALLHLYCVKQKPRRNECVTSGFSHLMMGLFSKTECVRRLAMRCTTILLFRTCRILWFESLRCLCAICWCTCPLFCFGKMWLSLLSFCWCFWLL